MTCREDYAAQIEENEVSDILMVKEGVFGVEKESVLRNADFFIMTSRYEGMPMSMIEAMSYGVPCFATKGTNLADEIREWDAGWSCETSIEGIVSGLNRLIIDVDKTLKLLTK